MTGIGVHNRIPVLYYNVALLTEAGDAVVV